MHVDIHFFLKLVPRWLLIWATLLAWWWGTWTLFNLGSVAGGLILGFALPLAVTAAALIGYGRRPSLEEDDA